MLGVVIYLSLVLTFYCGGFILIILLGNKFTKK